MNKNKQIKSQQIRALVDIHGICVKGNVYDLNDMKRLFPYIKFDDCNYFEIYFEHKFNINDKVVYNSAYNNYTLEKKSFTVTAISQSKNSVHYTIKDENGLYYTVNESEIIADKTLYIISFSNDIHNEMPAVHEISYSTYMNKIKNTWKSVFVFDDKSTAIEIAKLISATLVPRCY